MSDAAQLSPEEIQALRSENERLKSERDSERSAREAEARRADGLYTSVTAKDRELAAAEVGSLSAQEGQAEAAIGSITAEIAALEAQQAELWAEGKFPEAAAIGTKVGDATARRDRAHQAKAHFGREREKATNRPTDPVEIFLGKNSFADAEKAWIRANPRFATDADFQSRVTAAHGKLVADGVAAQSEEYFKGLADAGYMRQPVRQEPAAGERQPAAAGGTTEGGDVDNPYSEAHLEEPVEQPAQRQPMRAGVAASPSRRPATTPRTPPAQVNLTPDEAQAALAMAEYMPEDVLADGEAGIYAYWSRLKNSPTAKRLKAEWAMGG